MGISIFEDKVGLAVGVSENLTSKYNAVDLVKAASIILGGKGVEVEKILLKQEV